MKSMVRLDTEKAIAYDEEKIVSKKTKSIEQKNTNSDDGEAYIMPIFKNYANASNETNATASDTTVPPSLKGIIKRANNNKKSE